MGIWKKFIDYGGGLLLLFGIPAIIMASDIMQHYRYIAMNPPPTPTPPMCYVGTIESKTSDTEFSGASGSISGFPWLHGSASAKTKTDYILSYSVAGRVYTTYVPKDIFYQAQPGFDIEVCNNGTFRLLATGEIFSEPRGD